MKRLPKSAPEGEWDRMIRLPEDADQDAEADRNHQHSRAVLRPPESTPISPARMNDEADEQNQSNRLLLGVLLVVARGCQRYGEPVGDQGGQARSTARSARQASRYEQSRNRGSGQICLRDEAAGAAHVDAGPIVGSVTARGEDDRGWVGQPAKLLGDSEAVDVRQLHVEENEVRMKLLRQLSRRRSPFSASPTTWYPSDSRSVRALARKLGWSSTINTVMPHSLVRPRPLPNTVSHTLS